MNRWIDLPPIAPGDETPALYVGESYRVLDAHGREHSVTLERSPGGGRAFYDFDGEPVDALAIEAPQ